MKKILYGVYPWAFDCPGGGERQLMAWKRHLESRSVEVTLYDPWNEIPSGHDIFHFFSAMPGSSQLCDYMKRKGLKLYISPNLWVTEETKWNYPHDEIKRLLQLADKIIVNSRLEGEALGAVYDIPHKNFHVVYNGVESSFFTKGDPGLFRQHVGLGDTKYLLNVANVEERKNQLTLLKALKKFPDLKLVVLGNARDDAYLAQCKEEGGAQFIYSGSVEYGSAMLRSALAGAEGFVMPSTLETPSIAALEAAASGCKVLITSIGSTTEYFQDEAIYIVPDDLDSMEKGIAALSEPQQSSTLGQRIQQQFSWDSSVSELIRAYQET